MPQQDPWIAALGGDSTPAVDPWIAALGPQAPQERSKFGKAYDAVFTAPKFVHDAADALELQALKLSARGSAFATPANYLAGFLSGAGRANLTPGDAALTLTGLKGVRTAGKGIGATARLTSRLLSGAGVARGAENIVRGAADLDAGQAGLGLWQAAGNALGLRAPTATRPRARVPDEVLPALPPHPGPRALLPERTVNARVVGEPLPAGGVRTAYPPERPALPPHREPIITPAPRVFVDDQLGHLDANGNPAGVGMLGPVEPPAPTPHIQPDAPRPVAPTGPDTSLSPQEYAGIGQIIAELQQPLAKYQGKGTLHGILAGADADKYTRPQIAGQLQRFLQTRRRTPAVERALEVVRNGGLDQVKQEGLPDLTPATRYAQPYEGPKSDGWRRTSGPFRNQSEESIRAAAAAEAAPADDGDISFPFGANGYGPDAGQINPHLLVQAGTTLGGAAIGGSEGDTTEDRVKNALIGAAAGAVLPAAFRGAKLRPGVAAEGRSFRNLKGTALDAKGLVDKKLTAVTDDVNVLNRPVPGAKAMPNTQRADIAHLHQFPEEQRPELFRILEEHDGFEAQRRGVQPHARQAELAQRIVADLEKKLPKGTALNAEQLKFYGNALATLTDKIDGLVQKQLSDGLTNVEAVQLGKYRTQQKVVFQNLWGARSEAGRSLGALRMANQVLDLKDPVMLRAAAGDLRIGADEFARKWQATHGDKIAQYELLRDSRKPAGWERLRSYFYSNILSGPVTHQRNIVGNMTNVAANVGADVVTGKFGKAAGQVSGGAHALRPALNELAYTLKRGFSRDAAFNADPAFIRSEFAGKGANPFNWPGRALEAADVFFKKIVEGMETGRGSSPEVARQMGQRATFQEGTGKVAQAVYALRETVPGGWAVLPFVRIAANIARQSVEFSPAGFALARKHAGRERELVQGRAALASVVGALGAVLATQGRLTGNGPSDPGERQEWLKTGARPRSIRLGDQWVSYENWVPAATLLSTIANTTDAVKTGQVDEKSFAEMMTTAVLKIANDQVERSFFQGAVDLVDAIRDPDRKMQQVSGRLLGGFVPLSGAQRFAAQITDDTIREAKGLPQEIQKNIPGLSWSVPAKLDSYGNETKRAEDPWIRGLWQSSPVVHDPVTDELQRLGVRLGTPQADIKDLKLPDHDAEKRGLQVDKGHAIRERLETLIANPSYGRMADEQKELVLRRAISGASAMANNRARALHRRAHPVEHTVKP